MAMLQGRQADRDQVIGTNLSLHSSRVLRRACGVAIYATAIATLESEPLWSGCADLVRHQGKNNEQGDQEEANPG